MKRKILFRGLGLLSFLAAFSFYSFIKWPLRDHGTALQWVISLSIFFALIALGGHFMHRDPRHPMIPTEHDAAECKRRKDKPE